MQPQPGSRLRSEGMWQQYVCDACEGFGILTCGHRGQSVHLWLGTLHRGRGQVKSLVERSRRPYYLHRLRRVYPQGSFSKSREAEGISTSITKSVLSRNVPLASRLPTRSFRGRYLLAKRVTP